VVSHLIPAMSSKSIAMTIDSGGGGCPMNLRLGSTLSGERDVGMSEQARTGT
jgi:hypothetical protein